MQFVLPMYPWVSGFPLNMSIYQAHALTNRPFPSILGWRWDFMPTHCACWALAGMSWHRSCVCVTAAVSSHVPLPCWVWRKELRCPLVVLPTSGSSDLPGPSSQRSPSLTEKAVIDTPPLGLSTLSSLSLCTWTNYESRCSTPSFASLRCLVGVLCHSL